MTLPDLQARYIQALLNELGEELGSEERATLKLRTDRLGRMMRALRAREDVQQ